jgi:hypothetical protein
MPQFVTWFSPRGFPLVYNEPTPLHFPVLTVENYEKWYQLYSVSPGGVVNPVEFQEIETCWTCRHEKYWGRSAFVGHCPNPYAVEVFAHARGFLVCSQSLEMMIGRWQQEGL